MIRIFGVVNHTGNQYEMLKLAQHYDVKFSYLENNVRRWTKASARPEPTDWLNSDQFEWVTHYEPGKYDVAILHTDQQHADPAIGKGQLYRQLNELIQDIPKIVINHGTPMWDEMFTEDIVINGGEILDRKGKPRQLDGMKKILGDNFMVTNSYHAVDRWGWGYPLIHGMTGSEWWDLPKEPRSLVQLSPAGLDKYYNRQLLTYIKSYCKEKFGAMPVHIPLDYTPNDWDEQRDILGRSLLFISQQFDSPMSRGRTEAMLSGCCILSSRHDDAERFIENGVNGFLLPDNPISYADTINQLVNYNYKQTVEIGQRGKETALKYFNTERYLKDLYKIVSGVASGNPPAWDGRSTIYDS